MAKAKKAATPKPTQFFAKQLKGEEPLSLGTAQHLFRLASEIYGFGPWKVLGEHHMVFCPLKEIGDLGVISVMGSAGEFYSVMVYLGAEGYHLMRDMAEGDLDPGEYHAARRSLHVEFEQSSGLEKPDRELLRAMGHPATGKLYAPVFRSTRPGYVSWPVNETEGRALAEALAATIVFLRHLADVKKNLWLDGVYPKVELTTDWRLEQLQAAISSMAPPPRSEPPVVAPNVDPARIRRVIERATRRQTWWEIDRYVMSLPIGGKDERHFLGRCCLVADSGSGIILGFDMTGPDSEAGDALAETLLAAAEKAHALPQEIWVGRKAYQELLAPLGEQLGAPVMLMAGLPAIDAAKDGLMQFLSKGRG